MYTQILVTKCQNGGKSHESSVKITEKSQVFCRFRQKYLTLFFFVYIQIVRTIHSIAELLDCLKQIEREGLEGRRDNVRYYYRGEAEDYGPTGATPCIARNDRLKKEAKIFREAERRLPDEFAACRSTFEKLVLMQHYQIPTRLLDVTTSALQAVFFACYNDPDYGMSDEKEGCRDGVVYVYEVPEDKIKNYHSDAVSILANIAVYQHEDNLDIRNLDADEEHDRKRFNESGPIKYLLHEIKAEKPHFVGWIKKQDMEGVFCVHPLLNNPRIRAQQGAFMIYGIDGDRTKLAQWKDAPRNGMIRRKIRIPAEAKKPLLKELQMLGVTIDVVYPDWKGTKQRLDSKDFLKEM